MASRSEEDLSCPVCKEVFRDPVLLPCGHSFCKDCVDTWWREKEPDCPVCKKRCSRKRPPCNLVLRNLCESFLKEKRQRPSEPRCSEHSQILKLYCLGRWEPMCLACRQKEGNSRWTFRPIDEAVVDRKKTIEADIQDKTELYEGVKVQIEQAAEHIKVQARHTERQIKEQFKKLHQFLEEEEEARMAALREEEEQKSQRVKEKMEALSRGWAALSEPLNDTEDNLRVTKVELLSRYREARRKVTFYRPEMYRGALIDQAKHLGNLTFNIWNKMKDMVSYSPVVLDPNTAHPELILSEDLTSVRQGDEQQLFDNPERFARHQAVLGSEGFDSGTHSWDLEVGDATEWEMGVIEESFSRKDLIKSYCRLRFYCKHYRAWGPWPSRCQLGSIEDLKKQYQRIRMTVDLDEGRVVFTDLDTDVHLCTISYKFEEKVFPVFDAVDSPVQIIPLKITVTLEQDGPRVSTHSSSAHDVTPLTSDKSDQ